MQVVIKILDLVVLPPVGLSKEVREREAVMVVQARAMLLGVVVLTQTKGTI
jgi:hypothetical protein